MKPDLSKQSRLESFLQHPARALWNLALPIMAGMSFHMIYSITDMLFIGRLSAEALAAVAFNMPLFFLVMGLAVGIGSGVTAVIARNIGAQDKQGADNAAMHGILIGLVLGGILGVLGMSLGRSLLTIIGTPAELLPQAWAYLRIISIGLPFMVLSTQFRSILAGEGDTRLPMFITGGGTVLNILLDPLFIFGLDLGLPGAALATVISMGLTLAVFLYLVVIRGKSYITLDRQGFTPSRSILSEIVSLGLPASLSMVVMSIGGMVFNRILIFYSSQAVAAYQIAGRVEGIIFLPIMSIATGLVPIVGMFVGAQEIGRLKFVVKYGISRTVLVTALNALLLFLLAPVIVRVFTPDRQIQEIAAVYLRVISFAYPLIAIGVTSGRIMQGLGKGTPLLIITSVRVLLVSAPLASLFAFVLHRDIMWVWYAMVFSVVVSVSLSLSWLRVMLRRIAIPPEADISAG